MAPVDGREVPYSYRSDNAGIVPQVGDFVAYNYSGSIAAGHIESITRSTIKIRMLVPEEGRISRIKGGVKCVMVLDREGSSSHRIAERMEKALR